MSQITHGEKVVIEDPSNESSPFHRGEKTLQSHVGVRDKMERFGKKVIRSFMPKQHQNFFSQLPFLFVGHVDKHGWPWASIICNPPGFVSATSDTELRITSQPAVGDPLREVFSNENVDSTQLGLLGIELPTRRRNRLAGHVMHSENGEVLLKVDQSFGNCPKYIQSRDVSLIKPETMPEPVVETMTVLDEAAKAMISQADTFFVASYFSRGAGSHESDGADVSHRGGKPGFVRIDSDKKLTIPDYRGNNHFNTLGNIIENGKAGLLFLDFSTGEILMMTGNASVDMDTEEAALFNGAERLWSFEPAEVRRIKYALPLRWSFNDFSPNLD